MRSADFLSQDRRQNRGVVIRRRPSQICPSKDRRRANRISQLVLQRNQRYQSCPSPSPDGSHQKVSYRAANQITHPIIAPGEIDPSPLEVKPTTTATHLWTVPASIQKASSACAARKRTRLSYSSLQSWLSCSGHSWSGLSNGG